MKKSFAWLAFTPFLIGIMVIPSIFMGILGASSMTPGTIFVSGMVIFFFVTQCTLFKQSNWGAYAIFVICIVLALIGLQGFASFFVNTSFNFSRFWQSYILLIVYFLGALCFVLAIHRISEQTFDFALKAVFCTFVLTGMAGIVGVSPIWGNRAVKPVLFYGEPSHFALDFLPVLLYMVVQTSQARTRLVLILIAFMLAILLQNLTFILGIFLVVFFVFRLKQILLLFVPIVALTFIFVLQSEDIAYYSSRLVLSAANTNLSVLVFLQGWERAYLSLIEFSGMGLGFQQLGFVGGRGEVMSILAELGSPDLNLLDGGSIGAKFISELGVLGILIVATYLFYFLKNSKFLKAVSLNKISMAAPKEVFFRATFVMFFIDLFVRGSGYFSSAGFFFAASLMWFILRGRDNGNGSRFVSARRSH